MFVANSMQWYINFCWSGSQNTSCHGLLQGQHQTVSFLLKASPSYVHSCSSAPILHTCSPSRLLSSSALSPLCQIPSLPLHDTPASVCGFGFSSPVSLLWWMSEFFLKERIFALFFKIVFVSHLPPFLSLFKPLSECFVFVLFFFYEDYCPLL